jgi:ribulose-bisphosphate carboxylase small chain
MAVEAYKTGRKFETFSYLPPLDADQVRRQIAYAISQGWNPSVGLEPVG